MRQYNWIFAVVLVVVIATTGCSSKKYKEQISQRDARIAELENQMTQTEQELADQQAQNAQMKQQLDNSLADYQSKEQVWLQQENARTIITVSDAVMFGSGSADITEEGKGIIDRIAGVASQYPNRPIEVEGHSDDVPIGAELKDKYQSNWELSSARASSVVRYMYWGLKLPPERLSAIGYGEYRPIADNDTSQGRGRNRRVVIVIGAEEQTSLP